jgi:hypothetical protein
MIEQKIIDEAKKLTTKGHLKSALDYIRGHLPNNEANSLELDGLISRYNRLQKADNKGILSSKNYVRETNKITTSFLSFLSSINELESRSARLQPYPLPTE